MLTCDENSFFAKFISSKLHIISMFMDLYFYADLSAFAISNPD